MEVKHLNNHPMTYDEVSMERSKNFVNALQELKNLRPQLYSAAEYCEKSYLHSDQKEMVLDNLKDYAVRALVNAVDHLGTVAYKLTDLFDQQTLDVSTMEIKVSCANQKLLMCQVYMDKEGLRQQQLQAIIPRHHKHYVLPNSVNKKVHFSPQVQTDARQSYLQVGSHLQPSDSPASKTISWHLSSDTKSSLKGTPQVLNSFDDTRAYEKTPAVFRFDNEERTRSSAAPGQLSPGGFPSNAVMQPCGVACKDTTDDLKSFMAFRSFDNQRREMMRPPVRSKSMLSAFFTKQKTPKLKAGYVS
ncbi:hypothetical protein ACFE04_018124 [Oxalis oulophora]